MKYATPELLARFNSNDEEIATQADKEWEAASEQYVKYLETIKHVLPSATQMLLEKYYLHDAQVLSFTEQSHTAYKLLILLRLDTPPFGTIEIAYYLNGKPEYIDHEKHLPSLNPLVWLQDEFEVGHCATFLHSILFSGGKELRIPFINMEVKHVTKMLFADALTGSELEVFFA